MSEGILVNNDCHRMCFVIDGKDRCYNFKEIELLAEGKSNLSNDDKEIILRGLCQSEIENNIILEQRWRKIKPVDWSRYGL